MKTKPNYTATLLAIAVGETITETEHYNSFRNIKQSLKSKGYGSWKMKRNFDDSFNIKRIS